MSILEWYEILVWEMKGRMFVSRNYPQVVARMVKNGYNLVGSVDELRNPISRLLDEEEGAVSFEQMCNEAMK
jgi:hypothetical protein